MTNANDDHDFRQLAGRFNQPVAPSPTFAANLRNRLAGASDNALAVIQAGPSDSVPPPIADFGRVESVSEAPWRPARWMRTIEAAVAIVLFMSLAGASVLFRQPAALYDLAFQPATDSAPTEFNYGGDAGRTWVLGDVEPEMGDFRIDPPLPMGGDQPTIDNTRLFIGDSYVFTTTNGTDISMIRYDLKTKKVVWKVPHFVFGTIASDGNFVFTVNYSYIEPSEYQPGRDSARLTAIDFATGEIAWEGPELASRFFAAHSVILSGSSVYATDYLGNVVAANTTDGALLWQYPEVFAVPPADEELISQTFFAGPVIALNQDWVFVSQPSKAILRIDRRTGDPQESLNLVDNYGADISHSFVQVTDDVLLITSIRVGRQMASNSDDEYYPTSFMAFDPDTLELRTTTEVADFRGNALISGKSIYIPASSGPQASAWLYRIDPDTGDVGSPLGTVSDRWDMTLSASGNVLMATGDPSTIAFFDLDSGELLESVELGITNMETPFGQPVQMWGDNPIVITGLGEVYVIVDDPAR